MSVRCLLVLRAAWPDLSTFPCIQDSARSPGSSHRDRCAQQAILLRKPDTPQTQRRSAFHLAGAFGVWSRQVLSACGAGAKPLATQQTMFASEIKSVILVSPGEHASIAARAMMLGYSAIWSWSWSSPGFVDGYGLRGSSGASRLLS